LERLQELSVYYFLKDLYKDASFINIVDDFPKDPLILPTVSVESDMIVPRVYELGNRNRTQTRSWYFNIFAENKAQRDEYAYRLLNALNDSVSIYDYDQGFPPKVVTKLGALQPQALQLKVIKIDPALVEKLYYRSIIQYSSNFSYG
jgi:hypothetical protein